MEKIDLFTRGIGSFVMMKRDRVETGLYRREGVSLWRMQRDDFEIALFKGKAVCFGGGEMDIGFLTREPVSFVMMKRDEMEIGLT